MRQRSFDDFLPQALIGLAFLGVIAVIGLIIGAVIYDIKHPCVAWGPGTCGGGMYCAVYDGVANCIAWMVEDEYPCSVCTARQP